MTSACPDRTVPSAKAKPLRPRDAASLIIIDRAAGTPRVLMGRRRLDQVFLPGKYVFPGGRVDTGDRVVKSADELRASEADKLLLDMKGSPSLARARAIALAAIRETYEEAGLLVGTPASAEDAPIREMPGWSGFFACGFRPKLSALTLFARAITPPGPPRRYDTRFFCAAAEDIGHRVDARDGELSGLHWLTIEEARGLDLPSITRVILEDLMDHLRRDGRAGHAPVPYYHHKRGSFRRDLLAPERSPAQLDTGDRVSMVRASPTDRAGCVQDSRANGKANHPED